MKRVCAVLFSLCLTAAAFAQNPKAIIHTSDGDITLELYPEKAPVTVENFIGLSTGKKTWTDPKSGAVVNNRPLYNGTIFHRTIPGFMIQGGDPLGNGTGNVGFNLKFENNDLNFSKPGMLAMANKAAGSDTASSQFFITVAPVDRLTGGYTIFGQVTSGQDVVDKIVNKPTGMNDRPNDPTVIKSIEIQQAGAAAAPATKPAAPVTTATANQ